MSEYLVIIFLALLSGLTTVFGVFLSFIFGKTRKGLAVGMGFSAGIMILISLFELIPESLNLIGLGSTLLAAFSGVIFILVFNSVIPHIHIFDEKVKGKKRTLSRTYLIAMGLILHDFPEGFAMANSFLLSSNLGLLVAIGIALHNIPEEFAIATLSPSTPQKNKSFLLKVAVISGLAEPAGAVVGLLFASLFTFLNPLFLSFAAGVMVYISLHELLPLAKIYKTCHFSWGVLISVLSYFALNAFIPE